MKLIGYINAFAAYRERVEEVSPMRGYVLTELVETVRAAFQFQVCPQLPMTPEQLAAATLQFYLGRYEAGGDNFGVGLLIMETGGDIIKAMTTDQAEKALDHLVEVLDQKLGYRLGEASKTKVVVSNVVVEFDEAFERSIDRIGAIASTINTALPGDEILGLKRLAFGVPVTRAPLTQMEMLEMADFLIERRVEVPLEANRYYCSAPMRTNDHLALLAQIEAIAVGRA
jgi:enamine deaminase RidA (YjgF/YER057c/UK114 family)